MESITQEKNGSFNCDREEEKSVKSLIKKGGTLVEELIMAWETKSLIQN